MSTMNPSCDLQTKRNDGDDDDHVGPVDIQCSSEKKLESVTTTINDLTDPLLWEISIRLDAKSAHRCMSVSKTWLSQISSPSFVRSFIHQRIAVAGGRGGGDLSLPFMFVPEFLPWNHTVENNGATDHCSDEAFGPQGFSLDFLPTCEDVGGIGVVGSSGDLLLCRGLALPTVYFVCNPFTKKWVELPPSPKHKTAAFIAGFVSHPHYKVSLDHENKPTCDYIDSHYSYRVVRATFVQEFGSINLEIFSSEIANWRELYCAFEYPLPLEFSSARNMTGAFLCNGILHWMHTGRGRLVFACDPFSDYCAMMSIPEEGNNVHLGVYGGRLRVLNMLIDEEDVYAPCKIRVWERDEDKWSKVYDVSMDTSEISSNFLPDLNKACFDLWSPVMSIAFDPYQGDKVYMWFKDHFAWCNLSKGKFQMKEWTGFGKFHHPGRMVFSLVKPWFPTPVHALTLIEISENNYAFW